MPRAAAGLPLVSARGRRWPIAGTVCMDQFVVDFGDEPVAAGDEVVLFGPGDDGEPTAQEWGEALGTISYDLATGIGARVPRTLYRWVTIEYEPNGPGFPPAELRIATDADMRDLGRRLAALLRAGDLVILAGPLGAGKTTLVQGIGAGLGVRGPVTSPTFVIARVHPPLAGGRPGPGARGRLPARQHQRGGRPGPGHRRGQRRHRGGVGLRAWPNPSPRTAWRSRSSPIWTVTCGPSG